MNDDRLLHAALQDAADTRQVVIDSGVLASAAGIFQQAFGDQPAIIVADENTFDVAGREVQRQLAAASLDPIEPFIFPSHPQLHADYEHVLELESALRQHNAIPVAVGSGTLNDLTKLAAHLKPKKIVIPAS